MKPTLSEALRSLTMTPVECWDDPRLYVVHEAASALEAASEKPAAYYGGVPIYETTDPAFAGKGLVAIQPAPAQPTLSERFAAASAAINPAPLRGAPAQPACEHEWTYGSKSADGTSSQGCGKCGTIWTKYVNPNPAPRGGGDEGALAAAIACLPDDAPDVTLADFRALTPDQHSALCGVAVQGIHALGDDAPDDGPEHEERMRRLLSSALHFARAARSLHMDKPAPTQPACEPVCRHEWNFGLALTSNPVRYRCNLCGISATLEQINAQPAEPRGDADRALHVWKFHLPEEPAEPRGGGDEGKRGEAIELREAWNDAYGKSVDDKWDAVAERARSLHAKVSVTERDYHNEQTMRCNAEAYGGKMRAECIKVMQERDTARSDLASLRARVADLELIVRWAMQSHIGARREISKAYDASAGRWVALFDTNPDDLSASGVVCHSAPLDAETGLPILTPEARAALRGKESA